MSDLEAIKRNVLAFCDVMFNQCKPGEAVERHVGDTYIQHNPHVTDVPQGFIDYFDQMAAEHAGKHVEFKRVIAEGEFVVLHCLQTWPAADMAGCRHGRVLTTTRALLSFVWTPTARSLSTGTCYRSSPRPRPMTMDCSSLAYNRTGH